MKHVVLITNIPTPYRVPLFNELNRQLAEKGMTLHVVFGASGYSRRQFKVDVSTFEFSYSFLDSRKVQRGDVERTTFLYNGLLRELRRLRPDAIFVSGFSPATVKVLSYHLFSGVPYFIWNGSIIAPYRKEGSVKSVLRKVLASRAKGGVAYGSKARIYLESLGMDPRKVSVAINTVDTSFFRNETAAQRTGGLSDGKIHLLSIAYLSPRKNTLQLIEVMKHLRQYRDDVVLDLAGDGEQRAQLEALSVEYGLQDVVRFHGYVQKEKLPLLMSQAKLFLFQTDFDIWGLVLNEAMAAGLPVMCSHNAGAATDLIREGENGFVVDFNDPAAIAARIAALLHDPGRLDRIASAAGAYISEHATLAISAKGFVNALSSLNLES